MKISIFGGTGATGGKVIQEAGSKGFDVVALARHPEILRARFPEIEVGRGDVFKPETLTPAQVGRGRLGHKTPIKGLYLSGHWTPPGGGIYTVVVSGIQTAQMVLGYKSIENVFRELGQKNLNRIEATV